VIRLNKKPYEVAHTLTQSLHFILIRLNKKPYEVAHTLTQSLHFILI